MTHTVNEEFEPNATPEASAELVPKHIRSESVMVESAASENLAVQRLVEIPSYVLKVGHTSKH